MLVDDDPAVLATMVRIAIVGGHSPIACRGLGDVKSWFSGGVVPSMVVTDVALAGDDGIAVHDWIKATSPEVSVAFVTGKVGARLPKGAVVLHKPFEIGQFLDVVASGMDRSARVEKEAVRHGR
jgi:DNA-binding NtrC family response regulator